DVSSYTLNGWLYSDVLNAGPGYTPLDYTPGMFYLKDTEITHPSLTPVFTDGVMPDAFVEIYDPPPRGSMQYGFGNGVVGDIGRIMIARHPLMMNAVSVAKQPLPGAINMSYADGHAGRIRLEDLKTVYWFQGTRS